MARLPRKVFPDEGCFHVVAVAVHEARLMRDDQDALTYLRLLADASGRYRLHVHAFCLMTTHYHLVVDAGRDLLSAAIHHLSGTHATRFNRRHARKGHLFGDRFWCRLIDSDEQLGNTVRYVLWNPVRAGLCSHPSQWRWLGSRYAFDID